MGRLEGIVEVKREGKRKKKEKEYEKEYVCMYAPYKYVENHVVDPS